MINDCNRRRELCEVSAQYILFGKDERFLTHEIDKLCFGKSIDDLQKAFDLLKILFR